MPPIKNKIKKQNKKTITNREWLNSLNNEDFVKVIFAKQKDLELENVNPEIGLFRNYRIKLDFEEWLKEPHEEDEDTI